MVAAVVRVTLLGAARPISFTLAAIISKHRFPRFMAQSIPFFAINALASRHPSQNQRVESESWDCALIRESLVAV
jgi:hypothetical protein